MAAQRARYTAPTVQAYANELTAWREDARLSKSELSRLLGYTPQYLGQVEDCKNKPSRQFAEDCDTYFKTNGVFHRHWKNIHDGRYLAALPPGFPEYLERELLACTIRIFSALLIHGLFQTEEVIREIMSQATDTELAAEHADQRLERQAAILDRECPPQIFLTIDEGALRRIIGDKAVHRAQLQRLVDLAERSNIMVQVVPWDTGYYLGLIGSFTVLGFEDGSQAAYTESASTGILLDAPTRVAADVVRYDLIRGRALPVDESLSLIRTLMEGL